VLHDVSGIVTQCEEKGGELRNDGTMAWIKAGSFTPFVGTNAWWIADTLLEFGRHL
jgi:hypothetical protein